MKNKIYLLFAATLMAVITLPFNARAQASLAADIVPGTGSGNPLTRYPFHFTEYNGKLYFSAYTAAYGAELWQYDGTTATLAADIIPGSTGSNPDFLAVYNGKLYIRIENNRTELWQYDGTSATLAVALPGGSLRSNVANLTVYNGKLYFMAEHATLGAELWQYDGITATLAADINAGSGHSIPSYLTVYNNKLYFNAYTPTRGGELWQYDGVTASLAADINTVGNNSSAPAYLTVCNGKLYFSANNSVNGHELWQYDGTAASLAADINAGTGSSSPEFLTEYNGKLYFRANTNINGLELWQYDGTTATLAADIVAGAGSSQPAFFQKYNGKLYFMAQTPATGAELWQYDGTITSLAADIYTGNQGSAPYILTEYNGKLYFTAYTLATGAELWQYYAAPPCPTAGTACNDGNVCTTNDEEDGNCNCAGTAVTYDWYLDADADGYTVGAATNQCASPGAGYINTGMLGTDCDDNNASLTTNCGGGGAGIPTMSEWGLIILGLLTITMSVVFMTSKQIVFEGDSRQTGASFINNIPFNRNGFVKTLLWILPLAIAGFAVVHKFIGTNGGLDLAGTMVSAVIVAYVVHVIAGRKDS